MAQNNWTDPDQRRILSMDEVFDESPGVVAIMRDVSREYAGNTEIFQFGVASYAEVFDCNQANLYNRVRRSIGLRKPSIPRRNHSTLVLAETREGHFNGSIRPYLNRQIFIRPLIMAEDLEEYLKTQPDVPGLQLICNPGLDINTVEKIASYYKPKVEGHNWRISQTGNGNGDWNNWYATPASGIKRS